MRKKSKKLKAITMKIWGTNRILPFILFITFLTFVSCESRDDSSCQRKLYYEIVDSDSNIINYQIRTITFTKKGDTLFRYISQKELSPDFIKSKKYSYTECIISNEVFLVGSSKSKILSDVFPRVCTTFEAEGILSDVNSYEICFVKKDSLILNGERFYDAKLFKKTLGTTHKVRSQVYYDNNYDLLMEEYTKGYAPYFKIQRLQKIPSELKD